MATYYDIFGQKVQYISSDPTNVATGQIWYNSTTNVAKLRGVTAAAAWSSTTDRNNAMNAGAGAGTVTDAVFYGGYQPPSNQHLFPHQEELDIRLLQKNGMELVGLILVP